MGWRGRQSRKKAGLPFVPDPVVDALCEQGRWGWKTGKGWYRYEADGRGGFSRTALPDPEVDAILAERRLHPALSLMRGAPGARLAPR